MCRRYVKAADLVFDGLMPRSRAFKADLKAAGITKTNSQGRVVDFHSLRQQVFVFVRAGVDRS
jgi:hypothetical protein